MTRLFPVLAALALGCEGIFVPADDYNDVTESELINARVRMAGVEANLHDIGDVRELVRGYHYIIEPVDWWPSVTFIFTRMDETRHYYGDCQTAAVMSQWALGCIGVPASMWMLSGNSTENHIVTVADDGSLFADGQEIYEIESGDWRNAVRSLYPKFTRFDRIPR